MRGCLLCHAAGLTHEGLCRAAREALDAGGCDAARSCRSRGGCGASPCRASPARGSSTAGVSRSGTSLDPRPDTETLIEAALDLVGRWRSRPAARSARSRHGNGLHPAHACLPNCRKRAASAPILRSSPAVAAEQCAPPRCCGSCHFHRLRLVPCARRQVRPDRLQPALHRGMPRSRPPARRGATIRVLRSTAGTTGSTPIGASPRQQPGNCARAARFFSRSGRRRPSPWRPFWSRAECASRAAKSGWISAAGPEWSWQAGAGSGGSERRRAKKGLENRYVQVGSGQRMNIFGQWRLRTPGRLQRQQERITREPRLKGSRLSGRSRDAQPPIKLRLASASSVILRTLSAGDRFKNKAARTAGTNCVSALVRRVSAAHAG